MSDPSKIIKISFPDVDVECPNCKTDIAVSGYDFEPTVSLGSYGKATDIYCDDCDHEFDVVVGGVE